MADPLGHSQGSDHAPHHDTSNIVIRQMQHAHTRAIPLVSGQRKFLIVAIDYFTKWMEAEPLASITDMQVQAFILTNIITRFGVPGDLGR